jgi:hypothetical protein
MLVAKGFGVICRMTDGRTIRAPFRYALLHDESGHDWPSCSALVMPIQIRRDDEPVDDSAARSYFGTQPLGCDGETPSRNLSRWRPVGQIDQIDYTRECPKRECRLEDDYWHPIERGEARLYRLGRMLRIELGGGCKWNWRGIVRP